MARRVLGAVGSLALAGVLTWWPVEALAQADTMPPVLLEFTIDSAVVDSTIGDATFRATVRVADNLAGVKTVRLFLLPPAGSPLNAGNCIRTSGDGFDGIYDCTETLPQFSPLGTWTVGSTVMIDDVGNTVDLRANDLTGLGFPSTFQNVDLAGAPDVDSDEIPDLADNCPIDPNPNQEDADLDLIGDCLRSLSREPRQRTSAVRTRPGHVPRPPGRRPV